MMMATAPTKVAWNGNSGMPPPPDDEVELVELERLDEVVEVGGLEVVVDEEVLVLEVVLLLVDVVELVEELVVVVVAFTTKANVTAWKMVGGYAPQVAFTV